MSYTALYILVMVLSFLLMNSWIVLARFVQQVKLPPSDQEYEKLMDEKKSLEKMLDGKNAEVMDLKTQVDELEKKLLTASSTPASAPAPAS